MNYEVEVRARDVERFKSEFRSSLDRLDENWRRRFEDLSRRLAETSSHINDVRREVTRVESSISEWMMILWGPGLLSFVIILLFVVAAR